MGGVVKRHGPARDGVEEGDEEGAGGKRVRLGGRDAT